MISACVYAHASCWRTSGSSCVPCLRTSSTSRQNCFSYCTCWVVALPPRSLPSVVIVTRQPLCSPPMTLNSGARASVMNVSVKPLVPVIWRIGRSSKPFDAPSGRFIGTST